MNLDSLTSDSPKSCIESIEKNVVSLKSYLEQNLREKENIPGIPETGMAVLHQQYVLVEAIEKWIASLREKFE
ncbi:MAG: hypothetical protein K2G51_00295 [Lachnospiraceae bacterium]|nr:hypothetical protein [Lachnospiraceae bacterium]